MNIYQFMGEHYFLTFLLACILLFAFELPFRLINQWIRHKNIIEKGWPPNHLDADGDPIKDD